MIINLWKLFVYEKINFSNCLAARSLCAKYSRSRFSFVQLSKCGTTANDLLQINISRAIYIFMEPRREREQSNSSQASRNLCKFKSSESLRRCSGMIFSGSRLLASFRSHASWRTKETIENNSFQYCCKLSRILLEDLLLLRVISLSIRGQKYFI